MKPVKKILVDLGLKKKKFILRGDDRRKRPRRYERLTVMKHTAEYEGRTKSNRRKKERRKIV